MPSEEELIAERKKKLATLREQGIEPYPHGYDVKNTAAALQEQYESLPAEGKTQDEVSVAGRLLGFRNLGKITFAHIQDSTGKIQLYFRKDDLKQYDLLKMFDGGDWIGAKGTIFKSKAGELSVNVSSFQLLSKSLRPLPEKWHGLKDVEQRYRQRYLDLTMNPDVKEVFKQRQTILDTTRKVLRDKGYLEVEIPVLEPIYGGAEARPFKTFLNAHKTNVYLRIALELPLKKLLVGGFDKVFEIGKVFRNEDIDRSHNPEFTMMECYCAYGDYETMMGVTEDIYEACALALNGKTKVKYGDHELEFKKPWPKMTMLEAIKKFANIDAASMSKEELMQIAKADDVKAGASRGELINAIFEAKVEEHLIQPIFITHHPWETCPLAKKCREDPEYAIERFEPFACGMELANGYSELNDPQRQEELFKAGEEKRQKGDEEAHPFDADYIKALEHGMPPAGGLGIGIDRMTMLLTNKQSIRDVVLFPFMKQ
ncbi:MAG: lysine--tRNA ligase [Candidatus Woesearchaeota archaeon]|jgi:lysyl-tRNA synthetase class 2|nr:lysine--tRNA ligase [Candidatus Woesearchaeota archaeon]MDP7181444.1 lysine--tRNA ligase [Candidatus Woesearchaeota archaeon]MDP7198486.1 lysine--tRNA ligase [Candidatus Woesearchaeota archaeon]MDP7466772.1 lysine--tRNA ligase [Candidatus Woesearchaeota archaeon]MDP7647997.1 lysine--tRNA ligase [Candidatus Woesearchaeota archaeon]